MYLDSDGNRAVLNNWATPANIFELIATLGQLLIGGAAISGYLSVARTVRSNNIGIGIWNKQRAAAIDSFQGDVNKLNKASKILGIITVAIQVGEGIFTDINRGYSVDRVISNTVVNVAIYSATTIGLAKIGGIVGSFIPIPIVGTVVGTAAGYLIGLGVSALLELNIDGKSVIDHVRDWVYDTWNSWFN